MSRSFLLWRAVVGDNLAVVAALLGEDKRPVDYRSNFGGLLHHGVRASPLEFAEVCLKRGIDPNATDAWGATVLLRSIEAERLDWVDLLLNRIEGIDVSRGDEDGWTPLHAAAAASRDSSAALVRMLLSVARPGVADSRGGQPLHVAAASGNVEAAELLIESGAEVGAADDDGQTPLHYAAVASARDTVTAVHVARLLMRAGADVNALDCCGRPPLFACGGSGEASAEAFVVAILDEFGADVSIASPRLGTAAHVFAVSGDVLALIKVLECGCNPDLCIAEGDCAGQTALHCAATAGHWRAAILLFQMAGSSRALHVRDAKGMTPLHCAAAAKQSVTVSALIIAEHFLEKLNRRQRMVSPPVRIPVLSRLGENVRRPEVESCVREPDILADPISSIEETVGAKAVLPGIEGTVGVEAVLPAIEETVGVKAVLPAKEVPAVEEPVGVEAVLPAKEVPAIEETVGVKAVLPAKEVPAIEETVGVKAVLPAKEVPAVEEPAGVEAVLPAEEVPAVEEPVGIEAVLPAKEVPAVEEPAGVEAVLPAKDVPAVEEPAGVEAVLPAKDVPAIDQPVGVEAVLPAKEVPAIDQPVGVEAVLPAEEVPTVEQPAGVEAVLPAEEVPTVEQPAGIEAVLPAKEVPAIEQPVGIEAVLPAKEVPAVEQPVGIEAVLPSKEVPADGSGFRGDDKPLAVEHIPIAERRTMFPDAVRAEQSPAVETKLKQEGSHSPGRRQESGTAVDVGLTERAGDVGAAMSVQRKVGESNGVRDGASSPVGVEMEGMAEEQLDGVGYAPIHTAVLLRDLGTLSVLLDEGVAPDIPSGAGLTPLQIAMAEGAASAADCLLCAQRSGSQQGGQWRSLTAAYGLTAELQAAVSAAELAVVQKEVPELVLGGSSALRSTTKRVGVRSVRAGAGDVGGRAEDSEDVMQAERGLYVPLCATTAAAYTFFDETAESWNGRSELPLFRQLQGLVREDSLLMDDAVRKALLNRQCTCEAGGTALVAQPRYTCRTCGLTGERACCVVCIFTCHRGHNIGALDHPAVVPFVCQCAVWHNCHALPVAFATHPPQAARATLPSCCAGSSGLAYSAAHEDEARGGESSGRGEMRPLLVYERPARELFASEPGVAEEVRVPDVKEGAFADWNGALQRILDGYRSSPVHRMREVHRLCTAFAQSVMPMCVTLVEERGLPSVQRTVPFSRAPNIPQFVHRRGWKVVLVPLDAVEQAHKMVSHMIRNSSVLCAAAGVLDPGVARCGVRPPIVAAVNYHGHRVLCLGLIPANPKVAATGRDVDSTLTWLAETLGIKRHRVLGRSSPVPGDLRLARGRDGNLYAMNLMRLFPSAAVDDLRARPQSVHLHHRLRPELLQTLGPLSSDAFCELGRADARVNNAAVRDAVAELLSDLVPKCARYLSVIELSLHDAARVKYVMHGFGINLRHMGMVRAGVAADAARRVLLLEMIARVMFRLLTQELRDHVYEGDEKWVPECTRLFVNNALGLATGHQLFYADRIKPEIIIRFGPQALTADELETNFDIPQRYFPGSPARTCLLQRICTLCAVKVAAFRHNSDGSIAPFALTDIEELSPSTKVIDPTPFLWSVRGDANLLGLERHYLGILRRATLAGVSDPPEIWASLIPTLHQLADVQTRMGDSRVAAAEAHLLLALQLSANATRNVVPRRFAAVLPERPKLASRDSALEDARRLQDIQTGFCLHRLGKFYLQLSFLEPALDVYSAAVRLLEAWEFLEDPKRMVDLYNEVGQVHSQGDCDYAVASQYYKRAIDLAEEAVGPSHHFLVPLLENYAQDVFEQEGRHAPADLLYETALRIKRANPDMVGGAGGVRVCLYRAARRCIERGDNRRALSQLRRANAIEERLFPLPIQSPHPAMADTLHALAMLYKRYLDDTRKAVTYLETAKSIREQVYDLLKKQIPTVGAGTLARNVEGMFLAEGVEECGAEVPFCVVCEDLGKCLCETGEWEDGVRALRTAVRHSIREFGPAHYRSAYALHSLGVALFKCNDLAEGYDVFRRGYAYALALERARGARGDAPGGDGAGHPRKGAGKDGNKGGKRGKDAAKRGKGAGQEQVDVAGRGGGLSTGLVVEDDGAKVEQLVESMRKNVLYCRSQLAYRTGAMYKKGNINTKPKQRWFRLSPNGVLCYYSSKKAMEDGRNARGAIALARAQAIRAVPNESDAAEEWWFDVVVPGRTYSILAESELSRKNWMAALNLFFRGSKSDAAPQQNA